MLQLGVSIGVLSLVIFILIGFYALYHVNLTGDLVALFFAIVILILVGILILSIPCTGYQIFQLRNLTATAAKCATLI